MSDFVCCIKNDSNLRGLNLASLIVGKVYRTLPDAEAEAHNMLRIRDEAKSQPDGYRYPAAMFEPTSPPDVLVHCVHGTWPRGNWQQLLWKAKCVFRWLLTQGKPCTPAFPVPKDNREKRCWFEPDSDLETAVLRKLGSNSRRSDLSASFGPAAIPFRSVTRQRGNCGSIWPSGTEISPKRNI